MQSEILTETRAYLAEHVAPLANEMDHDPAALRKGLKALCTKNLMGLRTPAEWDGPSVDDATFRFFQVEVARVSGALAFLQTQHQSAVAMIGKSKNRTLQEKYLPHVSNGQRLLGIGFSQLRRPGPPIMRAEQVDGGYRMNGQVPWITGHGFYPEFVIAAELPSGEAVFAVVPFADQQEIELTGPMRLAAMEAAQTMSGEITDLFVPEEQVVFIQPKGWIQGNDMINVTLQGFFALGCARAGLDVLEESNRRRPADFLAKTHTTLLDQWNALSDQMQLRADDAPLEDRLRIRARAIAFMAKCAHAAVVSSSGAANSVHHPAQRIYRESIVFSVSAQTRDIMAATLETLTT